LIPEYFSPLANHLWQSTIVAGVASLLAFALRKNAARFRYWLWFSAAVKFLIPFSILVNIGDRLEWRTPPMVTQGPLSAVVEIGMPFEAIPTAYAAPSASAPGPAVSPLSVVLLSVWVLGFAVSIWIWFHSWWRVRAALSASTPMQLDLPIRNSRVRTMSSPALLEPAVFGIFKPVLVLPDGIADRLTADQLKAVLVHELCHVRRRDNLSTAIYMVAETLFWFYPPVRWIGTRMVDERERACDEEVLRMGNEPLIYAEGIVGVCKGYLESPLRCAAGVTGSDLKRRIRAILDGGIVVNLSIAKKAALAAAGIAVLAMPIVVGSMKAAAPAQIAPAPRPTVQTAELLSPQPAIQETKPQADKPATPAPATPTAAAQFEEASIRPCDPNNLPPAPEGMRGGGANSFQMTPGRTHALCMTLATLIRTAYGYGPAALEFLNPGGRVLGGRGLAFDSVYGLGVEDGVRVRGGPDWVRKDRFTIEAVAQGPSDPETMRGSMLRALLERRFQLKMHLETEEIPAFALTVDRRGLKIKPVVDDACERLPPPVPGVPNIRRPQSFADVRRGAKPTCGLSGQRNGPNTVLVGGGIKLESLSRLLGANLGAVQVLDKTGITDKFNFVLEFAIDENAPGDPNVAPYNPEPSDIPRAATIFTALEEQLGLRLEPAKTPREFIVIDRAERLSPN
jgi:bla regulator protein blaR1